MERSIILLVVLYGHFCSRYSSLAKNVSRSYSYWTRDVHLERGCWPAETLLSYPIAVFKHIFDDLCVNHVVEPIISSSVNEKVCESGSPQLEFSGQAPRFCFYCVVHCLSDIFQSTFLSVRLLLIKY